MQVGQDEIRRLISTITQIIEHIDKGSFAYVFQLKQYIDP